MKGHKHKPRKIMENEIVDWSKLVGKQISTYECSKPQLVCKNGTLEEKLLALSKEEYEFTECSYLIAHCADREYKQFCTSRSLFDIYYTDFNKALKRLHKKIGGNWDNVITFEFMHTHRDCPQFLLDPLSLPDIETADKMAKLLYPEGVKNIIMTAASENGYSFKYFPSSSASHSKYRKTMFIGKTKKK